MARCAVTTWAPRGLTGLSAAALLAVALAASPAVGAELSLRQIVETLYKAAPASRPDFAGKDLSSLDLSGLDFKHAILSRANLLGADLSDANLSFADLAGAKLDRARLERTNFTDANLAGASLYHAVGRSALKHLRRTRRTLSAPTCRAPASWRA